MIKKIKLNHFSWEQSIDDWTIDWKSLPKQINKENNVENKTKNELQTRKKYIVLYILKLESYSEIVCSLVELNDTE